MFRSLEYPDRSPWRQCVSLVAHIALIAVLIDIPVTLKIAPRRETVTLIAPLPLPKPLPPPSIRIRLPKPPQHVAFVMPTAHPTVKPGIVPPSPEAPRIEAAALAPPHLDLPPAPIAPKPAHEVKLGGFGDPNGAQPSPSSNSHVLAHAGAFDLPQGAGRGGAAGQAKVVASAGFGDVAVAGAGGSGKGSVKSAGFGDMQAQTASASATPAPARVPAQTPVEILSKPKPVYTAEARASRLEGEVQLEVVFSAAGAVHVVKVVRGLGLGLDEAASQAASQIRFRPGTRDGVPVDMKGIVHIVFELS